MDIHHITTTVCRWSIDIVTVSTVCWQSGRCWGNGTDLLQRCGQTNQRWAGVKRAITEIGENVNHDDDWSNTDWRFSPGWLIFTPGAGKSSRAVLASLDFSLNPRSYDLLVASAFSLHMQKMDKITGTHVQMAAIESWKQHTPSVRESMSQKPYFFHGYFPRIMLYATCMQKLCSSLFALPHQCHRFSFSCLKTFKHCVLCRHRTYQTNPWSCSVTASMWCPCKNLLMQVWILMLGTCISPNGRESALSVHPQVQ